MVKLLYDSGVKQVQNGCIFFGSCAGQDNFPLYIANLIGVLEGVRQLIIDECLLDMNSFNKSIKDLHEWGKNPSAGLWYSIWWAEGKY